MPQRKLPGDCQEPDRQLDDHIEGSRLVSPGLNQCEPVQTSKMREGAASSIDRTAARSFNAEATVRSYVAPRPMSRRARSTLPLPDHTRRPGRQRLHNNHVRPLT